MARFMPASLAAFLLIPVFSFPAQAGYLDVSSNWSAVSTIPMSKSAAKSVVASCSNVQARSNGKAKSGAMVVAGPHASSDKKIHLTVRLYNEQGKHDKSCHVYIGKNNAFTSCKCDYTD
jgi:hypothetical protein